MKFSIFFPSWVLILTFFFFFLQNTSVVESKLLMSVILNGGELPTKEGYTCTANDSLIINRVIGATNDDDFYDDHDDDNDEEDDRRLQRTRKCKDKCSSYVSGSCHSVGCTVNRRRTKNEDEKLRALRLSTAKTRTLGDDDKAICANGLVRFNKVLDSILPKLSEGCRSLVKNRRDTSCYDDVRYAEVEGFNLWNADTETIELTGIQNNTVICLSNRNLNIEAVANDCVEEIDIRMRGPVSRSRDIESSAPYYIFGDDDDDDFIGKKFPVGTYTIETELKGSFTPRRKLIFSIQKC